MRNLLLKWNWVGRTWLMNVFFTLCAPAVFLCIGEWMHRGTLGGDFFSARFQPHMPSYLLAWLLLVAVYLCLTHLTGHHWPAAFLTGGVCYMAGLVCYFKLEMRGEPFLPWDFSQLQELMGVSDKIKLQVEPFMILGFLLFLLVFVLAWFVHLPYQRSVHVAARLVGGCLSAVTVVAMIFGVFLQPEVCERFGIYEDMWMQDRYYKNHGVVTGFLTNLTVLNIDEPQDYSKETVEKLLQKTQKAAQTRAPLFANAYGETEKNPIEKPNIIFVMNESFWDVGRLEGITYDRELTPNLKALKEEGASGTVFSPSFGGGTCDVEFEALTGFAIENLPAGCKPYQQHVTKPMFSLPQYLRNEGYQTLAIHGYYRRFWSRETAYPNLGIDTFIAAEDFEQPHLRRGFISDHAMTQRIIEEFEQRKDEGPMLIHAVTMQNHTTYDAKNYAPEELVGIVDKPDGFTDTTVSQLRDFATGVHEADAALGELTDYLRTVEEPTILVFWGDHFNPMGTGYELYEKTGFIEAGERNSPKLRTPDLLMWSNYDSTKIDLGTLSSFAISPVMMELYGMEMPPYFELLAQNLSQLRGRSHGVTVELDGSFSETLTEAQQTALANQWTLQYDFMFGAPYQLNYTGTT